MNQGGTLEGVVLEKSTIQQVNVRDALVLAQGGIVIPEENIFYNDAEIEYDEDIDGLTITGGVVTLSWEEKAKRSREYAAQNPTVMVDISTQTPEIDEWIEKNKKKIERLLRPIVISLFEAGKD